MNVEFCTPDFSLLPAHIITQILRYLNIADLKYARTICKSWNYASNDPQIATTLLLLPTEENFSEICKSNRRYGILKLQELQFDKEDKYYFELFEKLCPFIHELRISFCYIKISQLLRLLELSVRLKNISFIGFFQLQDLPGLFPLDYECEAKKRIVKILAGVKSIKIQHVINVPFIADLVRCATNLETFEINNNFLEMEGYYPHKEFCTIFDSYNAENLTRLNWIFEGYVNANDFITWFVKIKNLNLKSVTLLFRWVWADYIYNSSLFLQFILKLRNLVELDIFGLMEDQLSLICQHLTNLKSLDCLLDEVQPISELANLKQLEKLSLGFTTPDISVNEIDNFFKCKFDYLQIFKFEEFVTEWNLIQLCENHSNLIELSLTHLLTRNLEIIFKHLTKLRILNISFGYERLNTEISVLANSLNNVCSIDSNREYVYKISRLQDLEEFQLAELVKGIREDDVQQLKKLHLTNLPLLFSRQLLNSINDI